MSGIIGKNASRSSGVIGTSAVGIASLAADSSPQLGGFLDAAGNYIQLEKGGDIASASPTVIDTDGDFFAVTGTTNFSAFTVAADRHFFLEFGGALTMTHGNGTLDLPGAANITTAASDVGEFVSTAANVVTCVNYTKRDGTAVVAAAGGAWTLIGTSVASDSATLDQTGLDSTYDTYCVAWSDIILATNGQNLQMRLGDSGGFDSGASDYSFHKQSCYSGSASYAGVVSAGASAIRVGSGMTNGTGVGTAGVVYLTQPADGATFPMVCGTTVTNDSTAGVVEGGMISGCRIAQITIDRVQIMSTSGNITSGRMTVWGIKHT